MGLFSKLKNSVDAAQSAANDIRGKAEQAKAKVQELRNDAPTQDNRPYAPMELLQHEQHECIKVQGSRYYQETIAALPGNFVELDIGTRKMKEWDSYPVTIASGDMVGTVYPDQLEKAGIKKGAHVLAEIHRPIYQMRDCIDLYIPRTKEAIEEQRIRDEMKLWVNIDGAKWENGDEERYDFDDVDVLVKQSSGKSKPSYVVIGDGTKLFEVNSRMKMYKEIESRAQHKPRRLIAERHEGDYGPYYRVGFYY